LNKIDNHQSQFFPTTKLPEHPKTSTSITINQGATITMSNNTGNPTPVLTTSPINKKRRGSNSLPDIIDQDIHTFSKDIEQLEGNTAEKRPNIKKMVFTFWIFCIFKISIFFWINFFFEINVLPNKFKLIYLYIMILFLFLFRCKNFLRIIIFLFFNVF
jgi:hypothetical protein